MEGSGRNLIDVLSRYLPGGTQESHGKKFSQDGRCPGRDWNPAPTEYMCRALPFCSVSSVIKCYFPVSAFYRWYGGGSQLSIENEPLSLIFCHICIFVMYEYL
jgi:hypothetical protein